VLKRAVVFLLGVLSATAAQAVPGFTASVTELPLEQQIQVVFDVDPKGSPIDTFELFFEVPGSGISISDLTYGSSEFLGQPVTGGIFGASFASASGLTAPFELVRFKATGGDIGAVLRWDLSAENFVESNRERTTFDGVVATVVPEPGTLILLGAGIVLLTGARRPRA